MKVLSGNFSLFVLDSVSKEAIGQIRWLISQVKTYSTFNMFLRYGAKYC